VAKTLGKMAVQRKTPSAVAGGVLAVENAVWFSADEQKAPRKGPSSWKFSLFQMASVLDCKDLKDFETLSVSKPKGTVFELEASTLKPRSQPAKLTPSAARNAKNRPTFT